MAEERLTIKSLLFVGLHTLILLSKDSDMIVINKDQVIKCIRASSLHDEILRVFINAIIKYLIYIIFSDIDIVIQ